MSGQSEERQLLVKAMHVLTGGNERDREFLHDEILEYLHHHPNDATKVEKKRQVAKWFTLDDGTRCGKFIGDGDVRLFRPVPEGYSCEAAVIDEHPVSGKKMGDSEWWVFLKPERGRL